MFKSFAEISDKRNVEKIVSQRGELLKLFRERVRDKDGKMYSYAFIGMKVAHLNIPDLCYLKSVCVDAENRGGSFGKVWFGSLKIR